MAPSMSERPSVCVFAGSSGGARRQYADAAVLLGRELLRRGYDLVYGGGSVGLMEIVADEVLRGGGRVCGVIPQFLVDREVSHHGLSELVVVASMHDRKREMAERASAFVALPGGLGTLEELAEVLTWAQLGLHPKPCGLLDVNGYYASLLAFLDHSVTEGFVRPLHRALIHVDTAPSGLLEKLEAQRPLRGAAWNPERI